MTSEKLQASCPLGDVDAELARVLSSSGIRTPPRFSASQVRYETVTVKMRDGVMLATDLYLPPQLPAPTIAIRTPYGRGADGSVNTALAFARRGYAVVSQDCRGTGGSEPDTWDYYMYESEDSYDLVNWIADQGWSNGFIGACGGSYLGVTQWQMAMHPAMSTIVPEVCGLGIATTTARWYMFLNAYARVVGKGEDKITVDGTEMERFFAEETMAGGYFSEPLRPTLPDKILTRFPHLGDVPLKEVQRQLWDHYCSLDGAGRADFVKQATGSEAVTIVDVESLPALFGQDISHDRHILPHRNPKDLVASFHAPVLLKTGWYDWGLNDGLATWNLLMQSAPEEVRSRSRLFIAPSAHNAPGYHEGMADHPELQHSHRVEDSFEFVLRWHEAMRTGTLDDWPKVIYYLMGANEWKAAAAWPPPATRQIPYYLGSQGSLSPDKADSAADPDSYVYNPSDPTPTVGGSILSYAYTPGSADVAAVQERADVLTYTTAPLTEDLDVVGPLRLVLYASSSAVDTDFVARLSDVFPDGRAIQLQNGILRTRYRDIQGEPELLEPDRVYRLEIDMWATANRFRAGHRIRVDISSADFPRFDRNSNRGGEQGLPLSAKQSVYHDREHPSHLVLPVMTHPS